MTDKRKPKSDETQNTADLNLATFIQEVKGVDYVGHFLTGRQLSIRFPISKKEMDEYATEYITSIHARCDATRRNFLRLLK